MDAESLEDVARNYEQLTGMPLHLALGVFPETERLQKYLDTINCQPDHVIQGDSEQ